MIAALLALVLGATLGIVLSSTAAAPALTPWIEPIGQVWVGAIRMTVIPLVVSSLVVAVAESGLRATGRVGLRAFATFLAMLTTIAIVTTLVAPPLYARLTVDAASAASLRDGVTASVATSLPSFAQWVVSLVPVNPVAAAAEGAMLPLVVFTLGLGLALGQLDTAKREPVVGFFRGVSEAVTVLIGWILRATPIGVFALAFTLAARIGTSIVGAVAFYWVTYSALLIVAIAMVYALLALFAPTQLAAFARAAIPAQVVAITTRSSMAALPAMTLAAETALRLPTRVTSLALPLAVSVFRLNQAVSWVVMALFAAKLYGVDLDTTTLLTLAVSSVLMSFSVPGIPSASLLVVGPFYAAAGIPAEAIGVLIALDLVPDVFKTLLNVTGQLGATTIVARAVD